MIYNWKQVVSRQYSIVFILGDAQCTAIDAPHRWRSQIRGFVIVTARNTKADVAVSLFDRCVSVPQNQSGLNETNIDCP